MKNKAFYKTLYTIFDQSKIRFDWSKMPSIDLEPIEQRSKWSGSNQNFNCIFDQSKNRFNWSKIWKTQIFEKQSNFLQKLLKALKFRNKMHEYEMKCFSKNTCFEPSFPKQKDFQSILLKFSSFKHIFHQIQGIFKLGWPNQNHTQ